MSETDLLRHCSAETRSKLNDTIRLRERAVAVLKSLQDAKRRCDKQLTKTNRTDAMTQVTGKSSLDEAIASAKRTIEVLDRAAVDAMKRGGVPELVISNGMSHGRALEREAVVS
jgi:hypothetical protein